MPFSKVKSRSLQLMNLKHPVTHTHSSCTLSLSLSQFVPLTVLLPLTVCPSRLQFPPAYSSSLCFQFISRLQFPPAYNSSLCLQFVPLLTIHSRLQFPPLTFHPSAYSLFLCLQFMPRLQFPTAYNSFPADSFSPITVCPPRLTIHPSAYSLSLRLQFTRTLTVRPPNPGSRPVGRRAGIPSDTSHHAVGIDE